MSNVLQIATDRAVGTTAPGSRGSSTDHAHSEEHADAAVGSSGRGRRARVTLRRRFGVILLAVTAMFAVGLGGTASANAAGTDIIIGADGIEWTPLGQYWVLAADGHYYLADAWNPPVGGARVYCWAGTATCWWDQHPWRQY